jgi:16S rRNA (uracil1498-N3)-methyltransferase
MRLSRLYVPQKLTLNQTVVLTDDAAHYLSKVLRTRPGQTFALFNGEDGEFLAEVVSVTKRDVALLVQTRRNSVTDSKLAIHIGLGLSRGERMDYAVQKATELGVTSITPLLTEFSEVKLDGERADKRTAHWQKVAISAAEQCGRCSIPLIQAPQTLPLWLSGVPAAQGFMLDHSGTQGFQVECPAAVHLLIGPEGGISESEKSLALASGLQCVRLGPRILRTETAPVVALTALQLRWGDF